MKKISLYVVLLSFILLAGCAKPEKVVKLEFNWPQFVKGNMYDQFMTVYTHSGESRYLYTSSVSELEINKDRDHFNWIVSNPKMVEQVNSPDVKDTLALLAQVPGAPGYVISQNGDIVRLYNYKAYADELVDVVNLYKKDYPIDVVSSVVREYLGRDAEKNVYDYTKSQWLYFLKYWIDRPFGKGRGYVGEGIVYEKRFSKDPIWTKVITRLVESFNKDGKRFHVMEYKEYIADEKLIELLSKRGLHQSQVSLNIDIKRFAGDFGVQYSPSDSGYRYIKYRYVTFEESTMLPYKYVEMTEKVLPDFQEFSMSQSQFKYDL